MIKIALFVVISAGKYFDILFDNIISYRGNFSILKYRASIFIEFIDLIYATDEVYCLDMSTRVIL